MNKILLISCLSMLAVGCSVLYSKEDTTLSIHKDGDGVFYLGSLNSACRLNIVKQYINADTLHVLFEAGLRVRSNNVLDMNQKIKYLDCRNKHNKKTDGQVCEIKRISVFADEVPQDGSETYILIPLNEKK